MLEEYVTVVFNEIHERDVSYALRVSAEFVIRPYDLMHGVRAAIVVCPADQGQWQADRYTSFMFGSRVFPTLQEAQAHLDSY